MKASPLALGALALALAAPVLAQSAPRMMAAQDLITLARVAGPIASPDGNWVV
jgi:hypothetical protein